MSGKNIFRCFLKSISSETSKSHDGLKAKLYKHYSNELAPLYLDAYNSWGKLGTMELLLEQESARFFCYKKVIKKILQNYRPIST